jgi:outer membrane cobalamin receptor
MKGARCMAEGAGCGEGLRATRNSRTLRPWKRSSLSWGCTPNRRGTAGWMKRMSCLITCVVLLCPARSVLAEEPPRRPIPTLDEVVVSATKTEEKRKDVPNAVILIGREDIEESPARDLGHVLSNEMGLDLRTYGNYGGASQEISIRGMGMNATQVLVNGIRVNSPSFGRADLGKIPLNAIERIEVVKGSGSVLYGSGAMGGTVSIITKSPKREKTDLKLSVMMGTQETREFSGEQGMFLTEDFGYYLTANVRDTAGFRENSDLTQGDASLKLLYDRGDTLKVSLYGDHIYRVYGLPGLKPPQGTMPYYNGPVLFYDTWAASRTDHGSDKDTHAALEIKSDPWDWFGATLRTDLVDMETYNYSRSAWTAGGTKSWTANQVYGTEGSADIRPFAGASLLLGADYKRYDWENKQVNFDKTLAEPASGRSTTTADVRTLGTYLEAQYRPASYVKGLAGIRHEDHSTFGEENLPRYGLVVNPREGTAFKLSHGKHFLAPTPNDLFWPQGPYTKGNPNLVPETGWHSDFTIEQGFFKDKAFLSLTYFDWDLENKIRWAPDASGVYTPRNLDRYEARGWEAGAKIGPLWDFGFSLSYTLMDAQESILSVTRDAEYTAEKLFKGGITYYTGFGLTPSCTFRYVGERIYYGSDRMTRTPVRTLEPYWTLDLRLDQRLSKQWVVSFIGSNLMDKEYDTFLGNFTDLNTGRTTLTSYPGSGRAMFMSVTYEY